MSHSKFDEIKIPSQIDEVINQNIQRALLEKSKPTRNYRKLITGVSASLLLFTVLGISNPAIASNIPFIKNIFEVLQENFRYPGNYSEYSNTVGETVYSNGIYVTVSDVLFDGETLHITYMIKKDTPFPYQHITDEEGSVKTDITSLTAHMLTADLKIGNTNLSFANETDIVGQFIDDYTFIGVTSYDLKEQIDRLPDEFIFNVMINEITNTAPKTAYAPNKKELNDVTLGSWAFKIPVTVQKDLIRTLTLEDNPSDLIQNIEMGFLPFKTYIDITYSSNIEELFGNYGEEFYDQDGNELINLDGTGIDENTFRYYFRPLDSSVTAIQIVLNEQTFIKTGEKAISYDVTEISGYTEMLGIVFDKTYPIN